MSDLVVITGATGDIGHSVARQLAGQGFVPVIGHRAGKTEVAHEIARSCNGVAVVLDMADTASIDAGIARLLADGRKVAGVVMAASPPPVLAPFGKITPAQLELFWTANVVGPHHLLAGMVRHCFRPQKAGSVVAILTKAMDNAGPGELEPRAMSGMGAYTISKYGLQGVLAQLRAEYPWLNVASIKPGFTETGMLKVFDERFLDQLRETSAFSRPEDVAADAIRLLALIPHASTT
ncbi:MAG: SDR family NAD(P)-dependent oxidoreductase [Beijerinckiaceae bacterium]